MIRVIYRWQVQPEKEAEFIQAWTQATHKIRHQVLIGCRVSGVRCRCYNPKPET